MLYNNYLANVSERFLWLCKGIHVKYNKEYGDEFEITLCEALRVVLPDRFGICRGYIVKADGKEVGDDIIIFDRERFGTLRLLEQRHFGRKERIPLETVCAFIEAKHTLNVHGDEPDGQSLAKALKQVGDAKALCAQQNRRIYGMIWSRYVRTKKRRKTTTDWDEIAAAFHDEITTKDGVDFPPDLIVAGNVGLVLPFTNVGGVWKYTSPFYLPNRSNTAYAASEFAFAIGAASLLQAIDSIKTDAMPWVRIIEEGLIAKGGNPFWTGNVPKKQKIPRG